MTGYTHHTDEAVAALLKKSDAAAFTQLYDRFHARVHGYVLAMLKYYEEGHTLKKTTNQEDFTIRLMQFFDHYLKEKPAPVWMTRGIPASRKGIDKGFELDNNINTPIIGGLLTEEEMRKRQTWRIIL